MTFPLTVVNRKERPCGECQACCEAVGVTELDKPTYTKCQHQCSTGCGIYKDRPPSCKSYYCLYQAGFLIGDERRRPDKLGVIFDCNSTNPNGVLAIQGWELWEGACDQPNTEYLLSQLGKKVLIFVRRYKSTRRLIIGPPERIKEIKELVEEYKGVE